MTRPEKTGKEHGWYVWRDHAEGGGSVGWYLQRADAEREAKRLNEIYAGRWRVVSASIKGFVMKYARKDVANDT